MDTVSAVVVIRFKDSEATIVLDGIPTVIEPWELLIIVKQLAAGAHAELWGTLPTKADWQRADVLPDPDEWNKIWLLHAKREN